MTDRPDLAAMRALAEAATPSAAPQLYSITTAANRAFRAACSPERILALIAEVERLRELEGQFMDYAQRRVQHHAR